MAFSVFSSLQLYLLWKLCSFVQTILHLSPPSPLIEKHTCPLCLTATCLKSNPKASCKFILVCFFLVFHHKISEVSRDEITFPVPFLSVEVKALFQGICNPARHSAVLFFSHFFHTDVVFVIIHSIGKANTTKTSKTSQLTGFAFLTLSYQSIAFV